MIPIMRNQNNPHPIKNVIGDTFDHFFTLITGGIIAGVGCRVGTTG